MKDELIIHDDVMGPFFFKVGRDRNITLCRNMTMVSKGGEEYEGEKIYGYYPNVEQAIRRMVRDSLVAKHKRLTLIGYLKALREEYAKIKNALSIDGHLDEIDKFLKEREK